MECEEKFYPLNGCSVGYHLQYCADWSDGKVVKFGGVWEEVPDMPIEVEPTGEMIRDWIHNFYGTL